MGQNFGACSIFNSTFVRSEETSSYWSVQFVHILNAFHWSPSIGKPYMTPESAYEFALVNTSRRTSYDPGILRQAYGTIQGLPMNESYEIC